MNSSTINSTNLDNLDNLRSAQGKNACGHCQYQLGCVRALHLQPELAQQFGFVARLECAASFVQGFQSTITPDTAQGDCRETSQALGSSDATSTRARVPLFGNDSFQTRTANKTPKKRYKLRDFGSCQVRFSSRTASRRIVRDAQDPVLVPGTHMRFRVHRVRSSAQPR